MEVPDPLNLTVEEDVLSFLTLRVAKHVQLAVEQLKDLSPRKLYGRYYSRSGIYNVFPDALSARGQLLGEVLSEGESLPEQADADMLYAIPEDGRLCFYSDGERIRAGGYGLYQDIFSRNSGILESDAMVEKRVVILGCGSVGSLVALELARSGVGHFYLVDADVLEYHNLCRHQCGLEDVGDFKVNAVKRKILAINPYAHVEVFIGVVQNAPKAVMDKYCMAGSTIFVGCADNRAADVYANRIASFYDAAFLSIGFWERAFAGEIFYHIPHHRMPCYRCALGEGADLSQRAQANHHVYSNEEDLESIKFEPGISVDINFITTIGIKLCIDILCAGDEGYIPRLLGNLTQYTLVCNTSDPRIGGEMVDIFSYPLQVTTSLAVGFNRAECLSDKTCPFESPEEH